MCQNKIDLSYKPSQIHIQTPTLSKLTNRSATLQNQDKQGHEHSLLHLKQSHMYMHMTFLQISLKFSPGQHSN